MKNLFEIFENLRQRKWSGEIQVTASEGFITVVLSEGKLFYTYRPIDRANEKYSQISWLKTVSEEAVLHIPDWSEYLRNLFSLNKEEPDRLIQFLRVERLELFFRCFFWSNVEVFPNEYEVQLSDFPELSFYKPLELSKLLKEAQLRISEWPVIQSRIGSSKRYFVARVPLAEDRDLSIGPFDEIDKALSQLEVTAEGGRPSSLRNPTYQEEEYEILRLCDGSHSVQDLIRECRDGEYLTLRRLIDLWDRGLVLPKDDEVSFSQRQKVQTKNPKREFFFCFFTFISMTIIFFGSHQLQSFFKIDTPPPQKLIQAIEVHRSLYGRYPVTLNELLTTGVLGSSFEPSRYSYKLLNLQRYELDAASE